MKIEYEIAEMEILDFEEMDVYTTLDVVGGSGDPEDDIFGGEY